MIAWLLPKPRSLGRRSVSAPPKTHPVILRMERIGLSLFFDMEEEDEDMEEIVAGNVVSSEKLG